MLYLEATNLEVPPNNNTCLSSSENKLEKKNNKNYLDLFINTSLNNMSIRSHLVSQPKNFKK